MNDDRFVKVTMYVPVPDHYYPGSSEYAGLLVTTRNAANTAADRIEALTYYESIVTVTLEQPPDQPRPSKILKAGDITP